MAAPGSAEKHKIRRGSDHLCPDAATALCGGRRAAPDAATTLCGGRRAAPGSARRGSVRPVKTHGGNDRRCPDAAIALCGHRSPIRGSAADRRRPSWTRYGGPSSSDFPPPHRDTHSGRDLPSLIGAGGHGARRAQATLGGHFRDVLLPRLSTSIPASRIARAAAHRAHLAGCRRAPRLIRARPLRGARPIRLPASLSPPAPPAAPHPPPSPACHSRTAHPSTDAPIDESPKPRRRRGLVGPSPVAVQRFDPPDTCQVSPWEVDTLARASISLGPQGCRR